jgi:hypothetical protein
MFSTWLIEEGRGLMFVGSGCVTWREIYEAKTELAARKDIVRPVPFAIIDLEAITALQLDAEELRQLASIDLFLATLSPGAVVAVVAPQDHVFGMARMWEVFAEPTGWRIRVFRSREEACAWVGMK